MLANSTAKNDIDAKNLAQKTGKFVRSSQTQRIWVDRNNYLVGTKLVSVWPKMFHKPIINKEV